MARNTAPVLTEADFYAQERENDRVIAFCLSGMDHTNVRVIDPEDSPETAKQGLRLMFFCEDCGHDISDVRRG